MNRNWGGVMFDVQIIWDMEDDEDGNVQHIRQHGLTIEDVEEVLLNPNNAVAVSRSSGEPITFGYTVDGRHIAVVWQHVDDDPLTMRPITAYETPPRRR